MLVSVLLGALPLWAELELGAPFTDHAVLQRGRPVPVWGTAEPGVAVTVAFAGQVKTSTAGTNGAWRIALDAMDASKEPREMVVTEAASAAGGGARSTEKAVVHDILVGEVWLASGQSNMDCPIWGESPRYRDASGALSIAMTRLPLVRYCKVPYAWSVTPQKIVAPWRTLTPENVRALPFSAIGFYFARELHHALDVPIGLVDSSWGGTSIDAWTPRCAYEKCDPLLSGTASYKPVTADKFVRLEWENEWDWTAPIFQPRHQPTVLWNAMVDAWCPMAMRGVIWYQGCANYGLYPSYCARLHALYDGWSRKFENPEMSFRFVQLAPCQMSWLKLVAAQTRFAAEEPHASIVVTADVGNVDDVHPNRKEIVAKRLVAQALQRDYGFDLPETDSPVLKAAKFAAGRVTLTFDHVKDWYVYSPDHSREADFELAGTNGVWHTATIENFKTRDTSPGPDLVLSSADVPEPVRVRYLGKERTMGTLFNEMSLPLGAFEAESPDLPPPVDSPRFDSERCLIGRFPTRRLTVEDNLAVLRVNAVPAYARNNIVRWLELQGEDMSWYRKKHPRMADPDLGEPLAKRPGFRLALRLDASRGRLPPQEDLKRLVGVLAACGFNELRLPSDAAALRALGDFSATKGVQLVTTPSDETVLEVSGTEALRPGYSREFFGRAIALRHHGKAFAVAASSAADLPLADEAARRFGGKALLFTAPADTPLADLRAPLLAASRLARGE